MACAQNESSRGISSATNPIRDLYQSRSESTKVISAPGDGASSGDLQLAFDYTNTDPNAYPNLLVTYEIVCAKGNNPAKVGLIKNFLTYISSAPGQATLPAQGYVKLPANLQSQVQHSISSIS